MLNSVEGRSMKDIPVRDGLASVCAAVPDRVAPNITGCSLPCTVPPETCIFIYSVEGAVCFKLVT
jgi:hypothetical protein